MLNIRNVSLLAIAVIAVGIGVDRVGGQDAQAKSASVEAARLAIIPVIVLKPGESKELILSTECTVGITRGGGFNLRQMNETSGSSTSQQWKREGIEITLPDFTTGPQQADAPEFAPLKAAGINAFYVKVKTTSSAKPGVYNFHLADQTCNGWCKSDFRVLVVAPR